MTSEFMDCQHIYYLISNIGLGFQINYFHLKFLNYKTLLVSALKFDYS
jgi:hypothetical protein